MSHAHFTLSKQTQTVDFTSSRYTERGKKKKAKKEGAT